MTEEFEFDDMDAFWEYIKAQGVQTARVWDRLTEEQRDKIREISPAFTVNIEALAAGNRIKVRIPVD